MAIYSLPSTTTSVSLYHLTPFRIIWLLQALPSPTLKPSNFTTAFTYIISRFLIYKQLWLCSKLSTFINLHLDSQFLEHLTCIHLSHPLAWSNLQPYYHQQLHHLQYLSTATSSTVRIHLPILLSHHSSPLSCFTCHYKYSLNHTLSIPLPLFYSKILNWSFGQNAFCYRWNDFTHSNKNETFLVPHNLEIWETRTSEFRGSNMLNRLCLSNSLFYFLPCDHYF